MAQCGEGGGRGGMPNFSMVCAVVWYAKLLHSGREYWIIQNRGYAELLANWEVTPNHCTLAGNAELQNGGRVSHTGKRGRLCQTIVHCEGMPNYDIMRMYAELCRSGRVCHTFAKWEGMPNYCGWEGMPFYNTVGGYAKLWQNGRVCQTIAEWEGMSSYGRVGGYAKLWHSGRSGIRRPAQHPVSFFRLRSSRPPAPDWMPLLKSCSCQGGANARLPQPDIPSCKIQIHQHKIQRKTFLKKKTSSPSLHPLDHTTAPHCCGKIDCPS